jgi:uncharacterized protein
MTGTFLNVGTVIAGSILGALAGSKLPAGMRQTVLHGLGLVTLLIGFQMAVGTQNILVVLGAVLLGGITGEALKIEERLESLGDYFQEKFSRGSEHTFAQGFVTASLVFCVGPMAILGSISDGLTGDYRLLSIKAVLDGFASIAFAASLGWGVLLSFLVILVYQGSITLFATTLSTILTEPMIAEMTATGGLIIVGIGTRLLDIAQLRLANFLPAILMAPVILALVPVVKRLL